MKHLTLVFYAAICQFIGTSVYVICSLAISVIVLRETHSLYIYAANGFAAAAIVGFMGPVFGFLSDRFGRARLVSLVAIVLLLWTTCISLLDSGSFNPAFAVGMTVLGSCLCSCLAVVSISLPRLEEAEGSSQLATSLSRLQIAEQSAKVIAPLMLFAFFPLSLAMCYAAILLLTLFLLLVTAAFYRRICQSELALHTRSHIADRPVSAKQMFDTVRRDRVLRVFAPYLAFSTACIELAAIAITPIVISYSSEVWLGLAFAIANASAVAGSFATARLNSTWTLGFALRTFLVIEGIGSILIAIESYTTSIYLFIAALAVGFFIMPASLVAAQYVWIGDAPKEQLGLLSGLERLSSWLLVPFAFILAPFLAPPVLHETYSINVEALRLLAFSGAVGLFLSTALAWHLLVSKGRITK